MRDAHEPPAFESTQHQAEFLEAFLRDQVHCLFELSPDCDDIAAWLMDDSREFSTSFVALCESADADHRVIRREILRDFHRRNLTRLALRGKDWERVRDWYLSPGSEKSFLSVMAACTGIAPARLAQEAGRVLSNPSPFTNNLACADPDLLTLGDHTGAQRIKEAA